LKEEMKKKEVKDSKVRH